ncbi:MAG: transcription initiation factor IIB [Thermoplasmata archaeon]
MKTSSPAPSGRRPRPTSVKVPNRPVSAEGGAVPQGPPVAEICPNCGSSHLIRDEIRGEIVCADCGLVVDQSALVSDRGQRGSKEDTGREARGWGPVISPLMPDKGLFSEIGVPTRDFQGNSLSRNTSLKFYHLRKLNHRLRAARTHQRNLVVALGELNRLAGVLGLSREVKESATYIYRRALEHKATRGKKIVALVAASVYAACRQCHVPRTMKEIIAHSKATKIEVGRAYTLLARELKLGLKPVEPRDYLVRFTQDLNLSKEVRQKVLSLLEQVEQVYSTSGVLPNGILATIIYIASNLMGEPRSQDRIAAVANVTPVTIRNHYKELLELLGLPKNLTNPQARGTLPGEAGVAADKVVLDAPAAGH